MDFPARPTPILWFGRKVNRKKRASSRAGVQDTRPDREVSRLYCKCLRGSVPGQPKPVWMEPCKALIQLGECCTFAKLSRDRTATQGAGGPTVITAVALPLLLIVLPSLSFRVPSNVFMCGEEQTSATKLQE